MVPLRAFAGLAFLLAVLAIALFASAGTLSYWEAWVFLGVFASATSAITIDLATRDPALLVRRMKGGPTAEPRWSQRILQSFASLAFVAVFVVSGLDHRRGSAGMPLAVELAGDALVALGLLVIFLVFRANTFTSATIEVEHDQRVISTGPYAVVRHPMYAGALLMLLGVPLSLGSWWALLPVAVLAVVIAARLLDEEQMLSANLAGYAEYRRVVRCRLVPFVW
ncbi:MAG: isoprenylcysteine carboxylmethyltransferase family protein [Polyangiaceae bacterium]